MEKMLTRQEAAEVFRVDVRTISEWAREKKIKTVRVGRKILIPQSTIRKMESAK